MRRTAGWVLFAAVLLWSFPLYGAPKKVVTLQRIDVTRLPDIDVYLTVTDQTGNSVLGLTPLEVTVAIDKAPQKIASLASAVTGGEFLAVALLFDRSGSMKRALDETKDAAVQFIRRLSVDDRMAVVSFDDKVRIDGPLTRDRAVLEAAVRGIATGKDTALYDAIQTALDVLENVGTRRQAILVLSDGKDTKSKLKADDVLSEAKKRGVPIYTLGLGDVVDPAVLGRLAGETGGNWMKAARAEELRLLYQTIADQLKNQYVLSFTSTFGEDEAWHRLTVDVTSGDPVASSAQREFIASRGLGVSRDVISGYEDDVEQRDTMRYVGFWAFVGLIAGVVVILLIRLLRPDVSLRSPLPIGIIVLTLLLGGIIALVVRAIRT